MVEGTEESSWLGGPTTDAAAGDAAASCSSSRWHAASARPLASRSAIISASSWLADSAACGEQGGEGRVSWAGELGG